MPAQRAAASSSTAHDITAWSQPRRARAGIAAAGRTACGDRHQRRRQVDADQHAVGRAAGDERAHRARRRRHHGLVAAAASARRHRPQLPAHHHLSDAHRVRERAPVRAGRAAAALGGVASGSALQRQHATRRGRRCRRAGLADVAAAPGRPAQPRPAAPARDRDVPGHQAARAAARRAAGRHGRRRDRAHARAADRAEARATRCCWSSTTWTPCSASPTASP